jgi:hypothetical protein
MIHFKTIIKKFGDKGEKTGWCYIEVSEEIASQLKPRNKKSFRVKGKLDNYKIEKVSLLPMGEGNFIMPINATLRKALRKTKGAFILASLEEDNREIILNEEFMQCLSDDPTALDFFNSLPSSHKKYFSKWIESAKTSETKAGRITRAVVALSRKMGYGEMMRMNKNENLLK